MRRPSHRGVPPMRRPSHRGVGNVDPRAPAEFDEVEAYMVARHTARMDKDTPRSVLDDLVQVSDDGNISVMLADSEHWDQHYDADSNNEDDEEVFPSDAQLNLARLLHAHAHARDLTLTRRAPMQQIKRELGQDIEGHDGRRWDFAVADGDGHDGGLWDLECEGERNRYTGVLMCTDVLSRREELPSPPALDGASETGRTYMQKTKRELGEDIEGHGGRRWDYAVADDDGRDSGLWDLGCDGEKNRHTGVLTCTGVMTRREKSPSPPALDDASATGRTYDDITKSPPPHLRCVVSPFFSLSPALLCIAVLLPRFFRRRPGV